MREVAVVGVGMAPFGRFPEKSAVDSGIEATLAALDDARVDFRTIEAAYCGVVGQGMTPGTSVFGAIGYTGMPIISIDNASASGSSAFREAYLAVAHGRADTAIATGIGKMAGPMGALSGPGPREQALAKAQAMLAPAGMFAMRANRRMHDYGTTIEHYAKVAVKNRLHASMNPYAQYRKPITVDDVMNARMICDPMTLLHCCPTGDGGAAAIVTTVERARQLGSSPLITVAGSAFRSEAYRSPNQPGGDLTELTSRAVYADAGIGPGEIDLVQIHDAFSVEEIEYYESLGFAKPGEGERLIDEGATTVGGRIPFSTDGGLLSRGHPLGPTGLAQIWETVLQLRGQAGDRQVAGAKAGLAHMIGAGGVCICHILKR